MPLIEPTQTANSVGPFVVGHKRVDLFDPARENRSLPYDIWYPSDEPQTEDLPRTRYPLAGPIALTSEFAFDDLPVSDSGKLPFLVFSHGSGGTNTQSIRMMEALASHGFVIVSPEHTGNTNADSSDTLAEAGAKRVPDVSFIIDTFMGRNSIQGDEFFERLDPDKIGVAGHSYGGGTALGMVGGFFGAQPDDRVKAVMPISAPVFDLFTERALLDIEEPVLFLGGTEDTAVSITNQDYAFDTLTNSSATYQIDIRGAGHNAFAAICDIGNTLIENGLGKESWPSIGASALLEPYEDACGEAAFPIEVAQRIQNTFAVAFFRRHLLEQQEYDFYLRTEWAEENEPDVNFRSRTK
ncbi:alpha/beta hydrolase family protein [Halioglobus maricola]|uniref:alpha/beta hydrolase family protein n=1 Tax=Halioglobus maricola TaxID=2601894 RepID=UPI0014788CE8|nr:dienelactone hydrolase family protein [Halioglobus maricola]